MPINNIPANLQAAIQTGFLETEFRDGLNSAIGYRNIADREGVAINVGETVTKTRRGLKAPVTTPIVPSANTNLDNGLTPSTFTVEQYTLGVDLYADTIDLNLVTSQVGIANQFLVNAKTNGTQARQSLDRLARNALFKAYMGGNSRVRTTLGAPALTIAVDDVRGFNTVLVNGVYLPVSSVNPVAVLVGSNNYNLTGVTVDTVNVSTAAVTGGTSGTLTFASNVTVADGTALNCVVHPNAPVVIRPNGKWIGGSAASALTATSALAAADLLTLGAIEDAVATLRNNTGIVDESFNLYLDNVSLRQLFADPDFKQMYQGQAKNTDVKNGRPVNLMGVNFVPTTEAPVQSTGTGVSVKVRRPMLVAQGALIEGDFDGMTQQAEQTVGNNSEIHMVDGVAQVTRGPIDRLQQVVSQSWYWIGGFVAPTDATANSNIIPTAGNQYLKRAITIEHTG